MTRASFFFSANGEAYARAMFNFCWTETHAHTIVRRSYADSNFHNNVKTIFFNIKTERVDDVQTSSRRPMKRPLANVQFSSRSASLTTTTTTTMPPAPPTFRKNAACLNNLLYMLSYEICGRSTTTLDTWSRIAEVYDSRAAQRQRHKHGRGDCVVTRFTAMV